MEVGSKQSLATIQLQSCGWSDLVLKPLYSKGKHYSVPTKKIEYNIFIKFQNNLHFEGMENRPDWQSFE